MKVTDELGDDEHPEFSDDEEERAYFAALKQKQKNEKAKCTEDVPQKRQRMGKKFVIRFFSVIRCNYHTYQI